MTYLEEKQASASIAQKLFTKVYRGEKNFMTPTVISYGITSRYAYELSKGEGISGGEIFGVTVINCMLGTKEYDLSQAFSSQAEAEAYIEAL